MKNKKILISIVILIAILIIGTIKVEAASAKIEASTSTAEVGAEVTITAKFTAAAWNVKVSGNGINGASYAAQTSDLAEAENVKEFKLDTSKAGTYTISITGDITDANGETKDVNQSCKVTINEKKVDPPVEQNPEPPKQQPETPKQEPEQPKVEEKPNFTDVNQTMYARKTINLRASWSTDSKATLVAGGTELKVTGTSTNKVNDFVWYRVSYNGEIKYVASYLLTDEKPVEEKPQEEPKEEPADEPTEEPTEEPTDVKQRLTSLEIEGITLSPKFDPEVFEYRVIVKEDISELKINAVSDIEGAVVSIAGNENLQEGENLITIVVYNAQNEAQATYQITTNKTTIDLSPTDKILQMGTMEAKRNAIIFVSILGMTLVALIIVMILRAINKKEDYNEEEQIKNDKQTIENKNIETSLESNKEEMVQSTETERPVEKENENSDIIKENNTKVTEQSTEKEINVENIMDDAKRQEYIDTIISEKRKGKYF